jgi:ribosome-binding protein aMBF1 (putative translation factor)
MELILQGGYQVKLKEEIEVNVPVPVRKVLQDIKMDTSKIHIKIKIDRSVLVSLEKGKIMPHANEIEEAVLGALLNDSNAMMNA